MPVNLPESRAKALALDAKPVQVVIDRTGDVYVDSVKARVEDLPALLDPVARRRDADGKPPQIFLRADQALDYGKVMRVMGELNRAGLNRVSMVTDTGAGDKASQRSAQ